MATFTPGYSFGEREEVSPTKLNNLVDLATVTGLHATNFGGGSSGIFFYGPTAPPIARGLFWYDTNAGSEGLRYAFLSASNGSISKWLYLTPRREGVFWTDAAVSLGYPLFAFRGIGHLNGAANPGASIMAGFEAKNFDGILLPKVWFHAGASGANGLMVVPTESAAASGPVVCAWAGFIQGVMNNSPITSGQPAWTSLSGAPNGFRDDQPFAARSHTWGVQHRSTGAVVTTAPLTVWGGGPAYEDYA